MDNFPSKLIEQAVNEISKLPGIGKKTALRLALHILKQDESYANHLGKAVIDLRNKISYCKECHSISDTDLCTICSNANRQKNILCVVEDVRDLIAIENTQQFKGNYHVLGGLISPMEGIGPSDLHIASLIEKVEQKDISEIIMALSTTIEGDTTMFYIHKKIKHLPVLFTTIARGISIGDEIEYADEITLGRSIVNRTEYHEGNN